MRLKRMSTGQLMQELEEFADNCNYQFSFQFWGKQGNNVYIERDGVELYSYGSCDTIREVLIHALEWLRRVNAKHITLL